MFGDTFGQGFCLSHVLDVDLERSPVSLGELCWTHLLIDDITFANQAGVATIA